MELEGRSVPRLYRLGYLEVALLQVDQGASFERIRQSLIAYAAQRAEERFILREGRDPNTFWSPTQEALSELMLLKFIQEAPLPSERKYVDSHRANTYGLTPEGMKAAMSLRTGNPQARADFLDMLSVALAGAHPGFQDLLSIVEEYPLCIPEYSIERTSQLAEQGASTQRLAVDAIERMTEHWPEGVEKPKADDLAVSLTAALRRRFPLSRESRPSQKDILDTINDAILGFVAKARSIRLDAISLNVCAAWASQLAVLEESRYVEGWSGRAVWATARIHGQGIDRHGFGQAGDAVIQGLAIGFNKVAETMSEARSSGYLPIYRVRAQAAFSARVNLRLVDAILARILSKELGTPYEVKVALGSGTRPPPSEPVFAYQGRRFFEIMITEKEKPHADEKSVEAR